MESADQREPIDILAEEFAARCRAGESPSLDEYLTKYPEHAEAIQELFPSVAMLEQLRRSEDIERELQEKYLPNQLPIELIDDYQIIREIGRGGMGIVYEALQRTLSRRVALKLLTENAINSPKQIHRFAREARNAAGLHHTNIVPVFGFGEFQGTYYYAMQFIDGVGLDEIIVALDEISRSTAETMTADAGSTKRDSRPRNASALNAARALRDGNFVDPRKPGTNAALTVTQSSTSFEKSAESFSTVGRHPEELSPEQATASSTRQENMHRQGTAPRIATKSTADRPLEHSAETDDFELHDPAGSKRPRTATNTIAEIPDKRPEPQMSVGKTQTEIVDSDAESIAGSATNSLSQPPINFGLPYFRSIARIGVQIAGALAYAHANRVLHRDIKPSNLLIDAQGTAWVTDFGLAKQVEQDDLTRTGDIVGTLRYMSPEQLDGKSDARSDIYSLGLTLYELLTLKPAFDATGHGRLVQQKTKALLVPPRKLNRRVPRDLETIILKCCAASPEHRYEKAVVVADDLQRFLEDRPILARRTNAAERLWRWSRRNPAIALSSAAAVLFLIAAIAFLTIGKNRTQAALDKAEVAQQQSEANLNLAIDAFEKIFDNIAARGVPQSLEMDFAGEDAPQFETVLTEADGELLKTLLAFHEEFAVQNSDDDELQAKNAAAYHRMGQIYFRLNRADDAEYSYLRAVAIYESLLEKYPGTIPYIIAKTQIMNDVGEMYRSHSMFNESFAAHRLARTYLESQPPEIAQQDVVRFELANTLDLLGSVVIRSGMRNVVLQPRSELRRLNQFRGFRNLGPNRRPSGQLGGGPRIQNKSRQPSQENRGEPPPPGLGTPENAEDPLVGVDKDLNQACEILEELAAKHPENTEYRLTLARANRHLLAHYLQIDQTKKAAETFDTAHNILLQLVKDYPDEPQYLFDLADTLSLTSTRLPSMRSGDAARKYLSQSIDYCSRLTREFPNVTEYQALLANTYGQLALVEQADGELDDASSLLELSREKLNMLVERYPAQSAFQISWVLTEKQAADLKREISLRDEDVFLLETSRDILLAAIERFGEYTNGRKDNPMLPRIMSGLYLSLAESYDLLGDRVEAFIAIAEAQKYSDNPWQRSLVPFGPPPPDFPDSDGRPQPIPD